MEIVVCVKRVPMTQEVDLELDANKQDVDRRGLVYVVNDWDNYAVEEAVLLREKFGGSITAVTAGSEDDEEVLRRALAMGADKAIRIDPDGIELDGFVISKLLAAVIKDLPHDLILTGVQADDDNFAMVGVMLAENLGLSHSAVVTRVEPQGNEAIIRVELEGGMDEVARIHLPAVLTIQTGINEPRYVSIMGIRKANKKPLEILRARDLKLSDDDLTRRMVVEEVFLPPEAEGAEMIEGDAAAVADEILRILKEKGVNV